MSNNKCLYCYKIIDNSEFEYHQKCSLILFGNKKPTILQISIDRINELASQNINQRLSITGVQPKLSLELLEEKKENRLTIVGLWGKYIFKPPFDTYPEIVELEDMTMHLAKIVDINTAIHGLIRFQSGQLGYLTKRFDRLNNEKIAVEDLCQLTETMTEDKYNSSMEKAGKAIRKYSDYSGLDKLRFFEIAIFCFLTGNADMHLKNFSICKNTYNEYTLSPAYDLIPTKLLIPEDKEETALTVNGKNSNLREKDFIALAENLSIENKVIDNVFKKFSALINPMVKFIDNGFISEEKKDSYKKMILQRSKIIGL